MKQTKYSFQRKYFFYTLLLGSTAGIIMYGTVRGLVMTNTIPRDVPFLKKLFITQYGDFGSQHIVDIDAAGIKIYNTQANSPIILAPLGQFTYTDKLTGNAFADRSITSRHIKPSSLLPEDFGISMINTVTSQLAGSCPIGQVMQGVVNGAPNCVTIAAGNGGCLNNGTIQGRTSTGLIVCSGQGGNSNSVGGGNMLRESLPGSDNIFYGTIDHYFGKVGIGLNTPYSTLHVVTALSGYAKYIPEQLIFTGGGTNINPKVCPYNSAISITDSQCFRHHGVCGTAHGTTVPYAPYTNLCALGTPTAVAGNGPWSWGCQGVNGGNNASCSANKSLIPVNGQCGSAAGGAAVRNAPTANLCSVGTPSAVGMAEGGIWANFNWSCAGANGGSAASCSVNRIVHGKCPNRLAFGGQGSPLGVTYGNQNSRAACQGINWNDPNMYVLNYTNVIGNGSSSAVYYTCQGINGGQPSGQCATYQSAAATFSMCGSAAGGTFSSTPTSNLCTWYQGGSNPNGSTSAVTVVNGPGSYQWYKRTCQQYGMTCSSCTNPGTYEPQTCYARKQ